MDDLITRLTRAAEHCEAGELREYIDALTSPLDHRTQDDYAGEPA